MDHKPTGYLLKQIHDALEKKANNDLRSMDLTMSQLEVLLLLDEVRDKSLPLKELENRLGVSQPTAAGIVKRMELKGFVESRGEERDRRIKVIRLTPRGVKLSSSAKSNIGGVDDLMFEGLTQEELSVFHRILFHIRGNLEKDS